jgi:hypothetical protein
MVEAIPFWELLNAGDPEGLVQAFGGAAAVVDDPRAGRIQGAEALRVYADRANKWLLDHEAVVTQVHATADDKRAVVESVLELDVPADRVPAGRWALPVAVVQAGTSGQVKELRVYHSLWPLIGSHRVRKPLLPADPGVKLPDMVAKYMQALAGGDAGSIVAAFDKEGVYRDPSGTKHAGTDRVREAHAKMFSHGGGLTIEPCTAIENRYGCALEYLIRRWGDVELPPQAGLAVFGFKKSGLLSGVRIYDDVDPPK